MNNIYQTMLFKLAMFLLFLIIGVSDYLHAQKLPLPLPLPLRKSDAVSGSAFKNIIENLTLEDREDQIYQQIMCRNVPEFLRNLIPISFSKTIQDSTYNVLYYVLPEYLSIGSDNDYFLIPMTPLMAQKIAIVLDYTLPTKQMVDQIWSQASIKLSPSPIPVSPEMTDISVMWAHNTMVKAQRAETRYEKPLGVLVAGHKKDVIISNSIYGNSLKRVVIYGWHHKNGIPI